MEQKKYEAPQMEIVNAENVDVITISLPFFNDDDVISDGWLGA